MVKGDKKIAKLRLNTQYNRVSRSVIPLRQLFLPMCRETGHSCPQSVSYPAAVGPHIYMFRDYYKQIFCLNYCSSLERTDACRRAVASNSALKETTKMSRFTALFLEKSLEGYDYHDFGRHDTIKANVELANIDYFHRF